MANNRELSQLGSFIIVDDSTKKIGIATTATPYVGIGTTNPQAKLHVIGDAIVSGNISVAHGDVKILKKKFLDFAKLSSEEVEKISFLNKKYADEATLII